MKAIAFGNRLARDFGGESFVEMSADARLEILDAINGGLQKLSAHASHESKTTMAAIYLPAPATITLGVTNGSAVVTGHTFVADDLYRTIRVDGDEVDNQIIAEAELLHPYSGTTGTVSATVYGDAATVPEPYDELVGNPRILETRRDILPYHADEIRSWSSRPVCEPRYYQVEPNARNQNPPAPAVIRFDSLPDAAYRLTAKFTIAPARVTFVDLLSSSGSIPLREEYVEIYLLPISRGILATSDRWKNADTRSAVMNAAEAAEKRYEAFIPRTLSTPANFTRTKPGF